MAFADGQPQAGALTFNLAASIPEYIFMEEIYTFEDSFDEQSSLADRRKFRLLWGLWKLGCESN